MGIVVNGLKKTFGKGENTVVALDGVSFEIGDGELTVLLGPSGSGKSTLLNIMGGMDSASEGTVTVFDKEITALNAAELIHYRRQDIGFVFQFYNLIPTLTAKENVQLACIEGGMTATEALEAVGLLPRANNFPAQLSGGEQQRVAIARAIVKRPPLLLCDEPTGALDSKTGRKIFALLQSLKATYGTTIVVVTHNATLATGADRVIKLQDGAVESNEINPHPAPAGEIEW